MTKPAQRITILISGRGSNMMSLVEAARAPDFPAEVAGVVSNRPEAAGLAWARAQGVRTHVIDHKAFTSREAFDAAVHAILTEWSTDLICLAGFMRIQSAGFVDRWLGRQLNIHPSLLPLFKGLRPHEQALAAGVRISGCTVHFVTHEMDAGPIVAQAAVPVVHSDTAETLAQRVLRAEHRLYPHALRLVASGRVRMEDGRAVAADALHSASCDADDLVLSPPAG